MPEIRKEKQTEEYVARDGSCANREEVFHPTPHANTIMRPLCCLPMPFLLTLFSQLRETKEGGQCISV